MGNLLCAMLGTAACAMLISGAAAQEVSDTIPLGGNAWRNVAGGGMVGDSSGGFIDNNGIGGWSDSAVFFDIWFRTRIRGDVRVWVAAALPEGRSRLRVVAGTDNRPAFIEPAGRALQYYDAGAFTLRDTGYQRIRLRAISRTGSRFADIPVVVVQGSAVAGGIAFVPNDEGNYFHWGRRGPSVHLNYVLPVGFDATWFYDEITVPPGQDVRGSYFMACGFAQGYFGMQVNSATERHVLFSVWSPYETDDPGAIPDSQRIVLLNKGDRVHTGEFGHEGSGGQSYLDYPWKAGRTYRFLLHAEPAFRRHTIFTAWWWAPEAARWQLIASFSRPETAIGLTRLHSFLENFEPETGNVGRMAFYKHAWAGDSAGHRISLNKATFTVDNTGRKGYRMDYAGGVHNGSFYLKNDGFFNTWTRPGINLERPADRRVPVALPAMLISGNRVKRSELLPDLVVQGR